MSAREQKNSTGSMSAGDALWDYASQLYGRPGVQTACLTAQDALGVDVNLLLFASWCARDGVSLSPTDIAAAEDYCRAWREAIVLPIRAQRRRWAESATGSDGPYSKEYVAIKALELAAERQQLEFLAAMPLRSPSAPAASDPGQQSARFAARLQSNLLSLTRHYRLADTALAIFSQAVRNADP
jgi:uncharacterized protein (TIGR02444 family)